jgi:outer membrane receptor protein involved in Fe transport
VGAQINASSDPKGHVTGFFQYKLNNWSFNFQDRWISGHPRSGLASRVYVVPRAESVNYVDVTIDREFVLNDEAWDAYLSIQNIVNTRPPVAPSQTNSPGLYFMGAQQNAYGYDAIGRYFTIGIRANL